MFTRKDLVRLILPLMIEQILAVTIGLADTVMVSTIGEAAVSAISLVDSVNILLINIFTALATGGAVVASQYLGRGDREAGCNAAKQLCLSITALSTLIATLAFAFHRPLLHAIFGHVEEAVMSRAETYFILSVISYPFLAVYNAGAALFRSMNNSKVSMFTSLLMNLVNICGNALLIYVFQFDVAGAGFASLASRVLGAVIMARLITHHENPLHIENLRDWRPHFSMIRRILNLGIPNGLEGGIFQIGKILVQSLIASFGTGAIAANAVANTVSSMEVIPGNAIGLALITVVGQCVGAGDYDAAKKYTVRLMKVTYLVMSVLNVAILFAAPAITQFFSLEAETARVAVELMWCHGVGAIVIWPIAFAFPNALRAAGDMKMTMLISAFSMWVFRIGMSYVLAKWMALGVLGVWIAMEIDWVFRAIAFFLRFRSGKWRAKRAI